MKTETGTYVDRCVEARLEAAQHLLALHQREAFRYEGMATEERAAAGELVEEIAALEAHLERRR